MTLVLLLYVVLVDSCVGVGYRVTVRVFGCVGYVVVAGGVGGCVNGDIGDVDIVGGVGNIGFADSGVRVFGECT